MASKYTAIIDVIVNKPQLQQQINQASQNAKANVKVSMNKADMDNQVKIWQNKLSSMKIKTPEVFNKKDVKKQVEDLQKQMGDWQEGLVPKSNVNAAWSNLGVSMDKAKSSLRNLSKDGYGFIDMMGIAIKKMIMWQAAAELLFGTMNQLKEMAGYVKEINDLTTNFQMITGSGTKETLAYFSEYRKKADELKIPLKDVIKGGEDWVRQGKSQADTLKLLDASLKLGTIARIDQTEATKIMTAITLGYNTKIEDTLRITDKVIAADNAYAVSAADIGEGLTRVGATAAQNNVTLDESIAVISVVGATMQDSTKAAEAFRIMLGRLYDVKKGKGQGEDGEILPDVSKIQDALRDLPNPIELIDKDTGQWRDAFKIMQEISAQWKQMEPAQQSYITKLMAGQRSRQFFNIAMQQGLEIDKAVELQMQSGGKTNEAYAFQLASVAAAQSDMTNAWGDLSDEVFSPEILIDLANAGKEFIKVLEVIVDLYKRWFHIGEYKLKWGDLFGLANDADEVEQSGKKIGETIISGIIDAFKNNKDLAVLGNMLELAIMPKKESSVPKESPQIVSGFDTSGATESIYDYEEALKGLGDTLKGDQDIYKEYIDTGDLSIEQVMKLKESHANYMDLITVEDGKVKLLTDKFKEQAKAQAQSALDTAKQNNASEEQIRILQAYVDQIDEEYAALDRLKMVKDAEVEFDRIGKELDQQVKDKEEANKEQDDLDKDLQANELALLDEQHEARLAELDSTLDKLDKWKTAREHDLESQEREANRSLELAKRASDRSFELRKRGLEKMKEARLKALDATVNNAEDEKKELENAHTAKMRAIEEEEKAQKRAFDEERKALDEQKKAELRALDEEEKARKRALDQKEKDLTKWHDEQSKALESNHDAELKAIEEEQQARDDAYEMDKKNLDDEHKRIQDGLKDQLDAYKKIIDAKKNALSNQQNERGYNQNVSAKNQEIGDIQSELEELQFDTSEEAAKRRLELQEQLAAKQLELDNLQYDHGIELQQSALDQELADYEEYIAQQQEMDDQHYEAQLAQLENEKKIFDDEMKRREDVLAEQLDHDKELLEAEYAARKETLDAEQQALQDNIDARRQSIEDAYDLEKEKIDKADQDYSDSIEKRKQQTDDLYNAQKDALDKEIEARKQAVENQKEMIQDSYDAQIQALEDEKQAVDDAFTDRGQREKDYFDAKKQQLKDDYDNYVANVKDKIKLEDNQYKANTKTINDFYDDAKKKRDKDLTDLTENVRLQKVAMADALELMKGDTQKKYADMTAAAQGYFDYIKGRIAEQAGQNEEQNNQMIHDGYSKSDFLIYDDAFGNTIYKNKVTNQQISKAEWDALPYHEGINAGFVGGNDPKYKGLHSELQSNEQFAKLMKGELVINPEQMDNFMSNILPNISGGNSTINIENLMPINVAGNLDKSVVNDIDTISQKVTGEIMKIMRDRGMVRNAKLYAL